VKFRVIMQPDAERDALEAFAWIAQDAPETAVQWFEGLYDAIASLSKYPRRCARAPESDDLGREIRQLLYKSHRVLFVMARDTVHVLHIRHMARDAWKG
jgi:plasmid stabilization system protein ParE